MQKKTYPKQTKNGSHNQYSITVLFSPAKSNSPKIHKSTNSLKLLLKNKYKRNILIGIIAPTNLFPIFFRFLKYKKLGKKNKIPKECLVKIISPNIKPIK